jgi:hypothetical protein
MFSLHSIFMPKNNVTITAYHNKNAQAAPATIAPKGSKIR